MKNNLTILIFLLFANLSLADELVIKAKNINIDKKAKITIFENEVEVKDLFNNSFKADYVLYNKEKNFLELKGNILSKDTSGNVFRASKASYDNNSKIFKSFGESNFETSEGYKIDTAYAYWFAWAAFYPVTDIFEPKVNYLEQGREKLKSLKEGQTDERPIE